MQKLGVPTFNHFGKRFSLMSVMLISTLGGLTACDPITPFIAGGLIAGTALTVSDRRTSGIQIEDKAIGSRAHNRIREALGEKVHVNANSYNLRLLLTGEVPDEATKAQVEKIASGVENVRYIVNELGITGQSSTTSRANDVFITSKVKAALVDEKTLSVNAFLITTERGTVYLMGRVTEREAKLAAEATAKVSGVQKVVKVMEIISEAELAEFNKKYGPAKDTGKADTTSKN